MDEASADSSADSASPQPNDRAVAPPSDAPPVSPAAGVAPVRRRVAPGAPPPVPSGPVVSTGKAPVAPVRRPVTVAAAANAGTDAGKDRPKGLIIASIAAATVLFFFIGAAVSRSRSTGGESAGRARATSTVSASTGGSPDDSRADGATPTSSATTSTTSVEPTIASTSSTNIATVDTVAAGAATAPAAPLLPVLRRVTTIPATTTTIAPALVRADPGGGTVHVAKGGTTTIHLSNLGGFAGEFFVQSDGLTTTTPQYGLIAPGGNATITVTASPGAEGDSSIVGVMEGGDNYGVAHRYRLDVFINNGIDPPTTTSTTIPRTTTTKPH